MSTKTLIRDFHKQAGIDDESDIPLQFAPGGYRVPRDVRLERDPCWGDELVLTWLDITQLGGVVSGSDGPPTAGCVLDFMSLGIDDRWDTGSQESSTAGVRPGPSGAPQGAGLERSAEEVLEFARQRGPLGIWPYQASLAVADGAYRLSERVAYYWGLARRMRTLLLLKQHLSGPHVARPDKAELLELLGRVPAGTEEALHREMADVVTRWMRFARLQPGVGVDSQGVGWQHLLLLPDWTAGFDWDASQEFERRKGRERLQPGRRYKSASLLPREEQRTSTVFAILVMQLAALLASPRGVIPCRICHRLFQPSRKPRADRPAPTCGGEDCLRRAHNAVQNASNRRKREKAHRPTEPRMSTS